MKACLLDLLIGTTEDTAANNISKLQSDLKVTVGLRDVSICVCVCVCVCK